MAETKIDISELKPNSHTYKRENGRAKLEPVIKKENVVSVKKPLSKKIAETFVSKDSRDIKDWVLFDVVIPGIKNLVLDMMSMMFFGEARRRSSSSTRTDYRSSYRGVEYGTPGRSLSRRRDSREEYAQKETDYRNIVLRNREDAERIVTELRKRVMEYSAASVADLFDLVALPSQYTDNNWGWCDERDIGIRRVSNGYLIDVAEPQYLN